MFERYQQCGGLEATRAGISRATFRNARPFADAGAHRLARDGHETIRARHVYRREPALPITARPLRHRESLRAEKSDEARADNSLRVRPRPIHHERRQLWNEGHVSTPRHLV